MRSLFISGLLAAAVAAAPTLPHALVHEKRQALATQQDAKATPVDRSAVLSVRIALSQNNLDQGAASLAEISDPSSKSFAKHWTASEVSAAFAPSADAFNLTREWLTQSGISVASQRNLKNGISFHAPVGQIEDLLNAQYHEYELQDGTIKIGCDQYSLPRHIAPHVDFITPGVLPRTLQRTGSSKRDKLSQKATTQSDVSSASQFEGRLPREASSDLRTCGTNITAACLRALYNIPHLNGSVSQGLLGFFEDGSVYSQEDLDKFFAAFAPSVEPGTHPELVAIGNASAPVAVNSPLNEGESALDLQIAYGLLGDVPISLYQVATPETYEVSDSYWGDLSYGPLLDAVDKSFCDSEDEEAGIQCGGDSLPSVLSISYGNPENYHTYRVQNRICNEFMKLGLQGHTFVVSSGDYGPADHPKDCTTSCLSRDLQTYDGSIFVAQFPATCPYVLSVGATQLRQDQTVQDPESAMSQPNPQAECTRGPTFSSSGGFSNYFPQPDYQQSALSTYFSQHDPGYSSYSMSGENFSFIAHGGSGNNGVSSIPGDGIYNRVGRGFPDVAANGMNYTIFVQGKIDKTSGTSAAAPVWASMIATINQERKDMGKAPVGFVNQVLYKHPEIFHDVSRGNAPGCGTDGWSAVEGWDPVTGLGTPDFGKMRDVFMALA